MSRTLLDNNAIENNSIKLIKLNEDITSILDKIKNLTFTTTIDNSSSDSQFPSAKAVYDQVELLYNSISSTNNVISGIQTVLTQLNTKINTNTSNISDNSTAITTLDNKVNTEVANINTELTTLTDNLSALSTTVTNNYASLSNLINTNVESLNNTITTNHTEFTEFVNTHNTEYSNLVTRVNNLGENVAGIQSNINTIKSDINTITTNLTALTTKVGTIESNLTTLSSDVEYFDIKITLGNASDAHNYDATLDKTNTEILSAISNNKKKIRILLNGETFYPINTSVWSDNSIIFKCLYDTELIMVSSNSDNTANVSLLSYLNTSNIITSPHNTYEDTQVLSASLADKINYYLVNITSIENLNLVTGYTNYYSGTCTLDKTFNELLEAINNKYNIQIYFSPFNSYCKVSTYVKDNSIIELSFILDRAFSIISYIKSTNKITITQYSISNVTNSISDDNTNAISSGAVYNLKTDLESKINSIAGYIKPFIINLSGDGSAENPYAIDKTFDEIVDAYQAKLMITLYDGLYLYPATPASVEAESIYLSFVAAWSDDNVLWAYYITGNAQEIIINRFDFSYALVDSLATINGEMIVNGGNDIKVGVPSIQAGKGEASEVFNDLAPENASGGYSHAEGEDTYANAEASHAEGYSSTANGMVSHAEGNNTNANGFASHSEGNGTTALRENSHAEGSFNVPDGAAVHSVGIGARVGTDNAYKDAHRITYDGKHYIIGIGGFDGTKATANLTNEKDLATIINEYETRIAALETALVGIQSQLESI